MIYNMIKSVKKHKLDLEILKVMLPVLYQHPQMDFDSILNTIKFEKFKKEQILGNIPSLRKMFVTIRTSKDPLAEEKWIMGNLRKIALGNMSLRDIKIEVGNVLSIRGAK